MVFCEDCDFVGQPARVKPGTTGTEVVLWLCLIVPGLIYSFWRSMSRFEGCANCGSRRIIPADSQEAKAALSRLSPTPSAQAWYCEGCGQPIFVAGSLCSSCAAKAGKTR
jgi:uncharacterized protein with PIN domain